MLQPIDYCVLVMVCLVSGVIAGAVEHWLRYEPENPVFFRRGPRRMWAEIQIENEEGRRRSLDRHAVDDVPYLGVLEHRPAARELAESRACLIWPAWGLKSAPWATELAAIVAGLGVDSGFAE